MKIADKIVSLTLFLLLALGVNTIISVRQIAKVGEELKDVVNRDIALAEITSALNRHQLEKAVQFERLVSVAEELAFSQLPGSRRQYLMEYVGVVEQRFHKIARQGAGNIIKAKAMLEGSFLNEASAERRRDLAEVRDLIYRIEKAHIDYDEVLGAIFGVIKKGDYQLSLEDLEQIQNKEKAMSRQLEGLLEEIRGFTQQSLRKAAAEEGLAKRVLGVALALSILSGVLVTALIIRTISRPLKKLTSAARQVGQADFAVSLDVSSRDEIGEVSRAFKMMAVQLAESKQALVSKNIELALTLKVTEAQKRDLEKVNRELDRFVYTVSHDIAAPLMGIAGYATYLQKNYEDKLDEKGRRSLGGIKRSTTRLSALINDLLTLTRISRINNPYTCADIQELVREAVERLEFRIQESGARVEIAPFLPAVTCDAIKLKEVFFNLISNAIKFSSKREDGSPFIRIGYVDRADEHEFFVQDNGIGIDPAHHAAIFGVFKRLHSADEYEGTGAGLSIVKNVIEDHGGRIWIVSQLGQGTEFRFTIPKVIRNA